MKATVVQLLIVFSGVGAALGIGNYGLFLFGLDDSEKDKVKDDPKPCCLPETWQGFVQTIYGTSERRGQTRGGVVTTEVFIDGQKKRVAGKVMLGCQKADFTFAGFYNETSGKGLHLYSYKTYNATKCWSHYWDKFQYEKPCIPQNATFKGSLNIGLKSSGWAANSFRFSQRRGSYSFMADMVVTKDGCVPLAFREIGSFGGRSKDEENKGDDDNDDGGGKEFKDVPEKRLMFSPSGNHPRPRPRRNENKFIVAALYNDLEPQIKDEKVFDLPDVCKKNPQNYPLDLDKISDPATREGFENMEAILEYVFA